MVEMPVLETQRLLIRPFILSDLQAAHRLLDVELQEADLGSEKMTTLAERADWLEWAVRHPYQMAMLNQPPYGDRAIVLKSTTELIGSCGLVPALMPFEQLPGYKQGSSGGAIFSTPEVGLFYAISPAHRGCGYAAEAAQALVDYSFRKLNLKRIIAKTSYDNLASQGVMRKLGMRIESNPLPEPAWLQVVGVLENTLHPHRL